MGISIFSQDGMESGFGEVQRGGGLISILLAVIGVGHYFNHCLSVSSSRAEAGPLYVSVGYAYLHSCIHSTNTC